MRIKVTEIEATAEDLRQSRTLAEAVTNVLRMSLIPAVDHDGEEDSDLIEPKKGRWIFTRYYVWECSECGKNPTRGMGYTQRKSELFRYCPYCGTEMEVKK